MRAVIVSGVAEVVSVLVFVVIGRHTHHDRMTAGGVWSTSWPFLAGLAAGLFAARAWRQPLALVPTGISAWLGAAVLGMGIRIVAGQGTAPAFIVVTLIVLAFFVLGWRLVVQFAGPRLRPAR